MVRATFTIAVVFLCNAAAATQPPVTIVSPCECRENHGEHRWAVKNDPSNPPVDASAIQAVTPSDVFSWPGPAEHLTQSSERTGIENNWFALTGRVVDVKVEMDGDLHLALQDATGDKAGIVVCEIPAKQQWCSIRETVFIWTTTRFPFHTSSAKKLTSRTQFEVFRDFAQFRYKHAVCCALEAKIQIRQFARIAQNYAVPVSEFVRKNKCSRSRRLPSDQSNIRRMLFPRHQIAPESFLIAGT